MIFLERSEQKACLVEGQCNQPHLKGVSCHRFAANYIDLNLKVNLALNRFWCQTVSDFELCIDFLRQSSKLFKGLSHEDSINLKSVFFFLVSQKVILLFIS